MKRSPLSPQRTSGPLQIKCVEISIEVLFGIPSSSVVTIDAVGR